MRRRLILTNVILLLFSLIICLGVSLYISRRNVLTNSKKNLVNYYNLVKNDIENGGGPDYGKYEIVEKDLRTTIINVTTTGNVYVAADSMYREDLSKLGSVEWLKLKEYSEIETFVVRKDDTASDRRMLYYVDKINNAGFDQYIRVGVPYNDLFEDNTTLIIATLIVSISIFIIMSFIMGQSIYQGIKPINKVIGSLEQLATSEVKEYDFQNIEDISNKINDVKNELEKNIKSIKNEKKKVELILENMGQGLIALNEDFTINLINKMSQKLLSIDDNYEGSFLDLDIDSKLKENIVLVNKELSHISYDLKFDDMYYNFSINSISNIWGDGTSRRIIIVITDVTDEKLSDLRQKEFFSNASHELRSPLTSIIGFQELIVDDFVGPNEVKELCSKTLQEGKRMQNLINDMLDLSALEKEEKGEVVKINLKEMIDDISSSLEPQLLIDNLTIVKDVDPYAYLIANQKHIYQLLRNLIDNAIKYNVFNGKIYITVKRKDNQVIISVRDTGVGISDKDQNQIFERFYRVDKARSRKLGSSGLGLAIVRQVCNIYAATLSLESKLNVGTTITAIFDINKNN
ncbi:MAG: GHKL domain-containing protein [bacterium]|nr:GHKL domain-containing protein [bacterium]